jgi:hypothetical protein
MWLYPLPALVALLGWLFLFVTSDKKVIFYSSLALLSGVIAFFVWSLIMNTWPFGEGRDKESANAAS